MRLTRTLSMALAIAIATSVVTTSYAAEAAGHFDPKGKPPSKLHEGGAPAGGDHPAVRRQARLRGAEEGFIAPAEDTKIMADAGHVAWDMERFEFLSGSEGLQQR